MTIPYGDSGITPEPRQQPSPYNPAYTPPEINSVPLASATPIAVEAAEAPITPQPAPSSICAPSGNRHSAPQQQEPFQAECTRFGSTPVNIDLSAHENGIRSFARWLGLDSLDGKGQQQQQRGQEQMIFYQQHHQHRYDNQIQDQQQPRGSPFNMSREERHASLFPKYVGGIIPLPDDYIIFTQGEDGPVHWTHSKSCTEILKDLDWTDEEAECMANRLYWRSIACLWTAGFASLFALLFILVCFHVFPETYAVMEYMFLGIFGALFGLWVLSGAEYPITFMIDTTFHSNGTRRQPQNSPCYNAPADGAPAGAACQHAEATIEMV